MTEKINPKRFGIMLPTSGFHGEIGKGFTRELSNIGFEVIYMGIPSIHPSIVKQLDKDYLHSIILEHNLSQLFTFNIPSSALKLPEDLIYHVWYQDPPVYPSNRKNDRIWIYFNIWKYRYGVGEFFPPATDYGQYLRPIKEKDYDAEISYAGFLPEYIPNLRYEGDIKERFAALIEVIEKQLLDTNLYIFDHSIADAILYWAELKTGCYLPLAWRGAMISHICYRVVRRARRYKILRFLADVCKRRNWRIKFAGNGEWESIPDLKRNYKGFVDAGPKLAHFFQTGKINIHSNGETNVHGRVFECLACGSFVLADRLVTDTQPGGIREFMSEDILPTFSEFEELEEKLAYYIEHPKARQDAVDAGGKIVRENHTYEQRVKFLTQSKENNANVLDVSSILT